MTGGVFIPTLRIELKFIARAWRFWLAVIPPILLFASRATAADVLADTQLRGSYLLILGFFSLGVSGASSRGTSLLELAMTRAVSLRVALCARIAAYGIAVAVVGAAGGAWVASVGVDTTVAWHVGLMFTGTLLAIVCLTLVTEPGSEASVWAGLLVLAYVFWLAPPRSIVPIAFEPWMDLVSPFVLAASIVAIGLFTTERAELDARARSSRWGRWGWSFGYWAVAALVALMVVVLVIVMLGEQ